MLNMDTLGGGGGGGRVIMSASSGKVSDGVASNQFPAGLRVLVVDDDPTCLKILERMLRNCLYEVTTCSRAIIALSMLRERKFGFDLVLSDVHMPDMDGFKLLECIGLEMDLPVIMMSVDDKKEVVMKGVTHGACDYLIKPIRIEAIKNIWQHVVRKRRNELKELEQSGSIEESDRNRKTSDDADYASSANEGSWKNSKRRKEEEDEIEERDDTSALKKPRVVWSVELHQQFVAAVNQLGIDKAVPKKILELMNVPGLTRENVASHLQKYRLYLRRLSGVSQHQSGHGTPFMGSQEASFGPMSSLDGFGLQALAVSTQLPSHSLAALQAGELAARSAAKTSIGTLVDQRNPFSTETSTVRFGGGQQLNGNSTQVNIFHGLPTNVEPKQLPHLHQPIQLPVNMGLQISEAASGFISLPTASIGTSSMTHLDTVQGGQGNPTMMQRLQSRSRGQLLNEISGGLSSGVAVPVGQQITSNEIAGQVLGRNTTILNGSGVAYNPGSQASPTFAFQIDNTTEMPGNAFPLGISGGVSSLQPKGMFQGSRSLEVKGSRGFSTSYDAFNEIRQGKTQDWELQNACLTSEVSRNVKPTQGNPDFSPAVSSHQAVGPNESVSMARNAMVSLGENQFGSSESIMQRYNNLPADSLFRIKTESMGDFSSENMYLPRHFGQDDLMSAILKQQQEAVGSAGVQNESTFDGYSIDDIPI